MASVFDTRGVHVQDGAATKYVVETGRLRLRWLTSGDAPFILELVNEPGWLRFIGDRKVHDLEAAGRYIENGPQTMYARHGYGLYAVEHKDGGEAIGMCGLVRRDGLELADLGFALLDRFQGHGYAREAAAATLLHAERDCGLDRLAAITDPANLRSISLLGSIGFKSAGQRRLSPEASPVSYFLWQSGPKPAGA
jgi:ribosomal-protein-alanine N-acetyltransferase